jgi:hypothetical protein
MLRTAIARSSLAALSRAVAPPRHVPAFSARALATDTTDVFKFVNEALELKGIKGKAAQDEVTKLKAAQIVSMDLLKGMNMHEWEKSGVSIGAARAVQDSLWQSKQNEAMAKVSLRRENSTKQELKQRRL